MTGSPRPHRVSADNQLGLDWNDPEHPALPTLDMPPVPDQIRRMIDDGALVISSHSGGKDSQAGFLYLKKIVPPGQLLAVHAVLPEVEWEGVIDHIEDTIGDTPLIFARARKTFFEMVEHRGKFPSAAIRQCTSDLKRGPIEREVRRHLAANPQFGGKVIMAMGMRAEESLGRRKLPPLKRHAGNSVAGREWWDWLPIHHLTTSEVFAAIAAAGQTPHPAYAAGMSRLSCILCIMSSISDLKTAARLAPEVYQRYARTEKRLGFTLSMSRKTLPEITGVPLLAEAT